MKKILLFIFLILMVISCGKFSRKKYSKKDFKKLDFNRNYDFKHKESFMGEASSMYYEWNFECVELNCNISYINGEKNYSNKIILKDYKQKNKIIKQIINGMKKTNEKIVIRDYYPKSEIIIYDKTSSYSFDSDVENEEFYKILDSLLGKDHKKIQ